MILHNGDCLEVMKNIPDNSIDFILADIPYAVVSRASNGLRNLDKDKADILSFDIDKFLDQCLRVCKGSICIFAVKNNLVIYINSLQHRKELYVLLSGRSQTLVP